MPPREFPKRRNVPTVSRSEMEEVDRLMMNDYRISLFQMMENAGRCLAIVARDRFLDGDAQGKTVVLLAGAGGNGGGAITAARRLASWGATVVVGLSSDENKLGDVPGQQFDILKRIASPASAAPNELPPCDVILDGLVGYSLNGDLRGLAREYVEAANAAAAPVLSLDVPSGFSAATGRVTKHTAKAAATMTIALPKTGMTVAENLAAMGQIYCADISVPPGLYREMGLKGDFESLFAGSDIVEVVP